MMPIEDAWTPMHHRLINPTRWAVFTTDCQVAWMALLRAFGDRLQARISSAEQAGRHYLLTAIMHLSVSPAGVSQVPVCLIALDREVFDDDLLMETIADIRQGLDESHTRGELPVWVPDEPTVEAMPAVVIVAHEPALCQGVVNAIRTDRSPPTVRLPAGFGDALPSDYLTREGDA